MLAHAIHRGFPGVWAHSGGGTGWGKRGNGFCPSLSAELTTLVSKNIKLGCWFFQISLLCSEVEWIPSLRPFTLMNKLLQQQNKSELKK